MWYDGLAVAVAVEAVAVEAVAAVVVAVEAVAVEAVEAVAVAAVAVEAAVEAVAAVAGVAVEAVEAEDGFIDGAVVAVDVVFVDKDATVGLTVTGFLYRSQNSLLFSTIFFPITPVLETQR